MGLFTVTPRPTFRAPVKLTVPGEETPAEIDVTFAHLPREAFRAWLERAWKQHDLETMREIVRDWSGVDEPYSEANLQLLLDNYPAASQELLEAYCKALTESRAKN